VHRDTLRIHDEAPVSPEIFKNWRRSGFKRASSSTRSKLKKGLKNQPLKFGAGEEGRTPDLMLGKQDQDSSERSEEDE